MTDDSDKPRISFVKFKHRLHVICKISVNTCITTSLKLNDVDHRTLNMINFQIKTNTKAVISCTTTFQRLMLHKPGLSPHGLSCLWLLVRIRTGIHFRIFLGLYFLMFAQNIKPTTIPPYNRGVLALVVLLGITMIVTFCGMSG